MIVLKSAQEIELMRQAGRIVAEVLALMREVARPGVTTVELDRAAAELIQRRGGRPTFKGYHGYPANICTMINHELVHGIPSSQRRLKDGDILSLDVGVTYKGYVGDAGSTLAIGEVSPRARQLIEVTEGSLYAGIAQARAGHRAGDISAAVQQYVESRGFSIIREYTGHGVGRQMHEEPQVPNFGRAGRGLVLKPGLTLALEPMVSAGDWRTRVLEDGWTVVTADGSLSAYFEHSIAITESDPEILTKL
ncbi:MAG TPA: type I methionyl aminopeptidase [Anaerolineae bacterium]|nr:type I methionyl aminopeptidase [Anaerolineae bacterium]